MSECEKGDSEFVVSSADAPEAFDSLEEVFDAMSLSVEATVERKDVPTSGLRWDADSNAKPLELSREGASIEAFICDEASASKQRQQGFDRKLIVALPTVQDASHQATAPIDSSSQFAVQSTFGFTYGLSGLSATRVGPVLMHFDVRAIDESQRTARLASKTAQDPRPQPHRGPSTPPRVDRTPRSVRIGQIPSRRARAHYPANRRDHHSVILARPTAFATTSTGSGTRAIRSISLAASRAALSTTDDWNRTSFITDVSFNSKFQRFENTP